MPHTGTAQSGAGGSQRSAVSLVWSTASTATTTPGHRTHHHRTHHRAHLHKQQQQQQRPDDMAISNFHVTFESSSSSFRPGDELRGRVVMDVWASTDIKFVEFVVSGRATLRMFQGASTFIERPRSEVYIDKKIILIGPANGKGVTLHPGRYVTSFQYTLPENLPPSVRQSDMGNGCVFDVSYSVKAHVCDKIKSHVSSSSSSSKANLVKIIKATKKTFTVLPREEWYAIPGALEPVVHTEQVVLFSGARRRDPTTVTLSLNRRVHPVGEKITVTVEVISSKKDRVRDVSAQLEQELLYDTDLINKFRRVLIKAVDEARNSQQRGSIRMVKSSFSLPLPSNTVPSHIPNCRLINLKYTLKVTVKFKGMGGKLIIGMPVVIAPSSGATRHDGELPLFNKPIMQFPYFSQSPNTASNHSDSLTSPEPRSRDALHKKEQRKKSIRSANVTTKYKTMFNCCGCCLLCLGFGILDS